MLPSLAGCSFKPEHFAAIRATKPSVGFFEIHAENYMGAGGLPHKLLTELRQDYPLSLHGVALSLGGKDELEKAHLARLKALIQRYQPASFSEHLAWSSHEGVYLNDLLPLPYTHATLARVCAHIDETQTTLGVKLLLENPSTYIQFDKCDYSETDFLREIVTRTGCGLLLDINNVFISSTNHQKSPHAYLADFPLHAVGEIHLGGHAQDEDDTGQPLLIDAHDRQVNTQVWALYEHVLKTIGAKPTLIEWDNDVPEWATLYGDVRLAQERLTYVSN